MTQFCISVPVGAYHPLLRDCLKSLEIQSPRPQIAFLDASNDPQVKVTADEFAEILTYRRHGPDSGQSDAIIEGWNNLDGDILGWLNADDALYPDAIARIAKIFSENSNLDVAYGHSTIIDDKNCIKGYHWAVEPPSDNILFADIISQPSCFFRRNAYEAIGGLNADLHFTMDWDLWVRFWRAKAKFGFVNETLSRVLWTKDAKTGGFNNTRRNEIDSILAANTSRERRAKSLLGFGMHYVYEYLLPADISRRLRRILHRSNIEIHGLGRDGEITNEAQLPLTHYYDESCRRIEVVFDRGAEHVSLQIEECNADQSVNAQTIALTLKEPFNPGEALTLSIKNRGPTTALFSHLSMK